MSKPNKITIEAMKEALIIHNKEKGYENVEDLFISLNKDD